MIQPLIKYGPPLGRSRNSQFHNLSLFYKIRSNYRILKIILDLRSAGNYKYYGFFKFKKADPNRN